ncbi:MAG: ABC transporter ATP-binding protein [Clostridiales bacterium]|jgi:ATP-binding cassette subfamily B protein|nr:ABC transporter ATP-binding protein [Clostridiales bacterium]
MKLFTRYLKPVAGIVSLGLLIKVFGTLAELALPYILQYMLDVVAVRNKIKDLILWGLIMIAFAVLCAVLNIVANRMAAKVARDAARTIRHDLFKATMNLSAETVDKFTVSSLESRLTTDTYNVHHVIGVIQRMGVRAPILLFGGLIMTFMLDYRLALVMLATVPLIGGAVFFVTLKGTPLFRHAQSRTDDMIRVVREVSQGIRVVKALSREEKERARYENVNRELVKAETKASATMAAVNPSMNLFLNFGLVAVILIGAIIISRPGSGMKPGVIIAFMQYFTLISNALLHITRIFVMLTRAVASAGRIIEVIDSPDDMEVYSSRDFPSDDGAAGICFDNVSFSYKKKKKIIKEVSFFLKSGEKLGIIGATGSGKTTLINLLMRFYDVDSGSVRIDGQDVRTVCRDKLHGFFGAAMQNDFIFSGTIRENIDFGRGISDDDIFKALRTAQAERFVSELDDGLDYKLNSKGTNLSGGQRQRLFIARAMAGKPRILVLDDSSSALDYKTDAALRRAIAADCKDQTVVIVAQRVSSVMGCDLILVIDKGRIIDMGKHEELMERCEVYRETSESQMGGAIFD